MALVRSLMPEEQQPRNYTLTGYPGNIWGYSVDEQTGAGQAAPSSSGLPSGSMWARTAAPMNAVPGMVQNSSSTLASRSPSGVSLSSAPSSYGLTPASAAPASLVSSQSSTASSPVASSASTVIDDELILTAIVVKNIPFAIKKEQLIEVMTQLGLPLPYAFNYHFDNGVFRGLAFANFSSPEETAVVIANLNGREIGGRKLRVEYKKMLPAQERERIEREKRERRGQLEEQHASRSTSPVAATPAPSFQPQSSQQDPALHHRSPRSPGRPDFNDPETLEIYSSLLLFQADAARMELPLGTSLMPSQVRIIQALCSQMQLQVIFHDTLGLTIGKSAIGRVDYPSPLFRAAAAAVSSQAPSTMVPQRTSSASDLAQKWTTTPAPATPASSTLFSEKRYPSMRYFGNQAAPASQHSALGVIGKHPETKTDF